MRSVIVRPIVAAVRICGRVALRSSVAQKRRAGEWRCRPLGGEGAAGSHRRAQHHRSALPPGLGKIRRNHRGCFAAWRPSHDVVLRLIAAIAPAKNRIEQRRRRERAEHLHAM